MPNFYLVIVPNMIHQNPLDYIGSHIIAARFVVLISQVKESSHFPTNNPALNLNPTHNFS